MPRLCELVSVGLLATTVVQATSPQLDVCTATKQSYQDMKCCGGQGGTSVCVSQTLSDIPTVDKIAEELPDKITQEYDVKYIYDRIDALTESVKAISLSTQVLLQETQLTNKKLLDDTADSSLISSVRDPTAYNAGTFSRAELTSFSTMADANAVNDTGNVFFFELDQLSVNQARALKSDYSVLVDDPERGYFYDTLNGGELRTFDLSENKARTAGPLYAFDMGAADYNNTAAGRTGDDRFNGKHLLPSYQIGDIIKNGAKLVGLFIPTESTLSDITLGLDYVFSNTGSLSAPSYTAEQYAARAWEADKDKISAMNVAEIPGSTKQLIVDQKGQIYVTTAGSSTPPAMFMDLSDRVVCGNTGFGNYDERGLYQIKFHPDFLDPTSAGYKKFYAGYSAVNPKKHTDEDENHVRSQGGFWGSTSEDHLGTLSEFTMAGVSDTTCSRDTERIVLQMSHPNWNHNGMSLVFDNDKNLLVGIGDGGTGGDKGVGHTGWTIEMAAHVKKTYNDPKQYHTGHLGNALDHKSLLGKILRVDPVLQSDGAPYGIPDSNPYSSEKACGLGMAWSPGYGCDNRPEIVGVGLRNPWQMSADLASNKLYISDVGQDTYEEVNVVQLDNHAAGVLPYNFGWRKIEGIEHIFDPNLSAALKGTSVTPVYEYMHTNNPSSFDSSEVMADTTGTSICGGYYYPTSGSVAALRGKFIFGDWGEFGKTPGMRNAKIWYLEEQSDGSYRRGDVKISTAGFDASNWALTTLGMVNGEIQATFKYDIGIYDMSMVVEFTAA